MSYYFVLLNSQLFENFIIEFFLFKNQKVEKYNNNFRVKMKPLNSCLKLKERLLELLSESTVLGVSKIISAKRFFFRIMWASLLISSSIACFFYTSKNFIDFFNYETITTLSNIQEESSLLPAVTICNKENPLEQGV